MEFWILHGTLHLDGRWPPAKSDGPYVDEAAARAAYRPHRLDGRLLPAAIFATEAEPTSPDLVIGREAVLDPEE